MTRGGPLGWLEGDRSCRLALAGGAAEWVEVARPGAAAAGAWRVEARLGGKHYRLADAFATKEAAQGSALLLAMRLAPSCRAALHAVLDLLPGVWWWKITPVDDESAEHRSIVSSRVSDSAEAAERSGRAAGSGWWLYVFGPGSARALGQVPR